VGGLSREDAEKLARQFPMVSVEDILKSPGDPRAMLEVILLNLATEQGGPDQAVAMIPWRKVAERLLEIGMVPSSGVRPIYLREYLGMRKKDSMKIEEARGQVPAFAVGDRVSWIPGRGEGLAAPVDLEERVIGTVVAIVYGGLPPERLPAFHDLVAEYGPFVGSRIHVRDHPSVLVTPDGEGKGGVHWPPVTDLRPS